MNNSNFRLFAFLISIASHAILLTLWPATEATTPRTESNKQLNVQLRVGALTQEKTPSRSTESESKSKPTTKPESKSTTEPDESKPSTKPKSESTIEPDESKSSLKPKSTEPKTDEMESPTESVGKKEQSPDETVNETKGNKKRQLLKRDRDFGQRAMGSSNKPEPSSTEPSTTQLQTPSEFQKKSFQRSTKPRPRKKKVQIEDTKIESRNPEIKIPTVSLVKSKQTDTDASIKSSNSNNMKLKLPSVQRKLIRYEKPSVPDWLEKSGQSVQIRIRYVIDEDGNVHSPNVLDSSGYPELDELVLEKLHSWKYESGKSMDARELVFRFKLSP